MGIKPYPPLPRTIPTPLGPVKIKRKANLKSDAGVACCGLWDHDTRTISIDASMTGAVAWQTVYHELVHVALTDSGVTNLMSDAVQESVCDSVASLLTASLRAGTFSPEHPPKKRVKKT